MSCGPRSSWNSTVLKHEEVYQAGHVEKQRGESQHDVKLVNNCNMCRKENTGKQQGLAQRHEERTYTTYGNRTSVICTVGHLAGMGVQRLRQESARWGALPVSLMGQISATPIAGRLCDTVGGVMAAPRWAPPRRHAPLVGGGTIYAE